VRLFISVDLPEAWKQQLPDIERSIGWLGRGVKWVDPQTMHLTLRFLGETPETELQHVKDTIAKSCAGIGPFEMQMRGTGCFPNHNRPRVYWVGLKSHDVLLTLNQKLELAMQDIGFPPEEHPFRPHLTVARIKDPIGKERMTAALINFKIESEPIIVSEVLLMQSFLDKAGPTYQVMGRTPLRTDDR
jgi:2'-5' RNA ligase